MSAVFALPPHDRMTVEECLAHCHLTHADFREVLVVGVSNDGRLMIRSSGMSRADAAFLLLHALDHAKGVME